ncbi:hypothetical protein IQ270_03885 [Microcoleus sp. LEGE 07076]|uniref:hypothetical protein n=1 Tax=Microcoleus sp. LEGE 07076 TaxID=915322 RepID=UPI001880561F|nr:hypothetical protein [Microcoleus sp. LEGE 07076]MBE9183886.1 hypothetical protein [Microcoleus sp. LEGE 07076]
MTSTQVTLSGFDQFAPKAFLIALARYEAPLSPELIAEVNNVGEALVSGKLEKADLLINIAQKDAAFSECFNKAYEDLLELDESEEKNKFLPELDENTPPRETDDYNNFLAPPLTNPNPQSVARKLLGKATDLVERVYRLRF